MEKGDDAERDACQHERKEFLGEDKKRNQFFRCEACGAALVTNGVRWWTISERELPGEE